jgi:hypothetical protein
MTTSFFTIDNNGYLIVNVENLDRDPPSPGTFRFQVLITQHSSYHLTTTAYEKRSGKNTRDADILIFIATLNTVAFFPRTPAWNRISWRAAMSRTAKKTHCRKNEQLQM